MRATLLLLTTALTLSACGQKANDTTPNVNAVATMGSTDNAMGAPDNGAMPMPVSTDDFVSKAAMGDMYEIAASKLASTMATTPALKAFAAKMIAGHTETTKGLKAAKAKDNVIAMPATTLDPEHQGLIDALKATKGADFDTLYKTQQTDAHTKALALMEGYAANGDKPALKAFATETAPKVKSHLDMISAM